MRLIDADALENRLYESQANNTVKNVMYRIIRTTPTIDAVLVVRCGKCKYWETDWEPTGDPGSQRHFCSINDIFPTGDWFCADGKHREEVGNG